MASQAFGLKHYEVRWAPTTMPGAWEYETFSPRGQIDLAGRLDPGVEYEIQIRCVPQTGLPSEWVSLLHTVTGFIDPTPTPHGLSVVSGTDHNKVTCRLPAKVAADVEVEFQWTVDMGGVPVASQWAFLDRGKKTEAIDTYPTGEKRWYRCRTVDYQGNFSSWSEPAAGQAKMAEDGATATAPSTENLLGSNAEKVYSHSGNAWLKQYLNSKSLKALGLDVGEKISVSFDVRQVSGDKRVRILIRFIGATTQEITSDWYGSSHWERAKLEGLVIPEGTFGITLVADMSSESGEAAVRRAMLNVGHLAAPFSPPATGASTGSAPNLSTGGSDESESGISTPGGATPPRYRGGGDPPPPPKTVIKRVGWTIIP